MGYTNKTSHYDLPQWIAGDKPSWLGDVNTAMLNIDTAIAGADASASAAESSAAAANAQVQAQEAKITKNTTDIQALTEQVANVSGVANGALPKNGGTMTGALTLAGAPTQDLQAATKKYVDENSGKGALMLTGGTMTGPLTLSGAPTADLMAATKKYVDDATDDTVNRFSCNSSVSGSVSPNVTSGLLTILWNKFVASVSVISGSFAQTITTTSLSTQVFIPMFVINGNPFKWSAKTPAVDSDILESGISAILTDTPVSLAGYYNNNKTVLGMVTYQASVDGLKGKSFKGFGSTAV